MSEKTQKKMERIQKWDILKCILIFLVVLGHICDMQASISENLKKVSMVIYTFHMPLFIYVSGMFSRKMIDDNRVDKMFRYLVLFYFTKLIFWLYYALVHHNYIFRIINENGVPWFMFALFIFAWLTMKLKDVEPLYVLGFWIILACMVGYDSTVGDILVLSRIIVFYPFYFLGYYMDPEYVAVACRNIVKKIVAWIVLITLIVLIVVFAEELYPFRALLSGRNSYSTLGEYAPYGFWLRLALMILSTVMGACIIIIVPDKLKIGTFAKIGRRTLPVYCFHYLILYGIYQHWNVREWVEENIPALGDWHVVLVAMIIVWVLSRGVFNNITNIVYGVKSK